MPSKFTGHIVPSMVLAWLGLLLDPILVLFLVNFLFFFIKSSLDQL